MNRQKISFSNTDNTNAVHRQRRQSILPTSPQIQEMIRPGQESTKSSSVQDKQDHFTQRVRRKKARFEDRYTRVTTYVDNTILQAVRDIQHREEVSFTSILNEALRRHLGFETQLD